MEQQTGQTPTTAFPGNVLVAGCGFVVTGGGWGLFGYIEGDLAATSSAGVFFAMAALHILVGVLVFSRLTLAVPAGLLLATVGLIIAALQPQFVLMFTNIVIIALLLLARRDIAVEHSSG
jgi:hypothetical protein